MIFKILCLYVFALSLALMETLLHEDMKEPDDYYEDDFWYKGK
jgi:hypothetical protein